MLIHLQILTILMEGLGAIIKKRETLTFFGADWLVHYINLKKAYSAISVDNGNERCQVLLCKYRITDASVFHADPAKEI